MNIRNALEIANRDFINCKIENYFFETRELMGLVLKKEKEWIMCNLEYCLPDNDYKKFLEYVKRRVDGEPFQYILGEQEFMKLKFIVNESVLIPRSDTEILVSEIIKIAKNMKNVKILDLCTGSGCIAISLGKYLETSNVLAIDISEGAIDIAKENAKINEVNIKFLISDLFEKIDNEKFDIIVSNPPYIDASSLEKLSKDVKREPELALNGGEDGLKFYKLISEQARNFLKDDGFLCFEIGYNQAVDVANILKKCGYKGIEVLKDYSSNDRVIIAQNICKKQL